MIHSRLIAWPLPSHRAKILGQTLTDSPVREQTLSSWNWVSWISPLNPYIYRNISQPNTGLRICLAKNGLRKKAYAVHFQLPMTVSNTNEFVKMVKNCAEAASQKIYRNAWQHSRFRAARINIYTCIYIVTANGTCASNFSSSLCFRLNIFAWASHATSLYLNLHGKETETKNHLLFNIFIIMKKNQNSQCKNCYMNPMFRDFFSHRRIQFSFCIISKILIPPLDNHKSVEFRVRQFIVRVFPFPFSFAPSLTCRHCFNLFFFSRLISQSDDLLPAIEFDSNHFPSQYFHSNLFRLISNCNLRTYWNYDQTITITTKEMGLQWMVTSTTWPLTFDCFQDEIMCVCVCSTIWHWDYNTTFQNHWHYLWM